MEPSAYGTLQFESFHSAVDATFWYELEKRKLVEYKLDNSPKIIVGEYTTGGEHKQLSCRFHLSRESFVDQNRDDQGIERTNFVSSPFAFVAPGTLINCNTIEDFKNLDKNKLLREIAQELYNDIKSGEVIQNPSKLCRFVVLTFADLKAHKFYYWFAFPTIAPSQPVKALPPKKIGEVFDQEQVNTLRKEFSAFRDANIADASIFESGFFAVRKNTNGELYIHSLKQWNDLQAEQQREIYLGFADPSALEKHPGWPLRNLLLAAGQHFGLRHYKVICFRETSPKSQDISNSLVIDVELPERILEDNFESVGAGSVIGWEKNADGKYIPRFVDLGSLMDPTKLAESSVSLNIQLMKWRMLPSLDTDLLARTKCLLIGSGTLGCHVARNLMAWGIFNITFIDRGKVSYSNPVRQPLFEFEDCLGGGKNKAEAAAEHLKKIYPNVNVKAYNLSVPMPGHIISPKEQKQTKEDVEKLTQLIEEHDAIFLLTDSRESRWLPTLLATQKRKITINAALGFDSYLVMRHGMMPSVSHTSNGNNNNNNNTIKEQQPRIGCYFCNDVVAPADSLSDRTLDQQCTVTRPGVSAMAGSLAVELLTALLQHPHGAYARADTASSTGDSPLGLVPHQIRGFVTNFQTMILTGMAYKQCTACSEKVVNEYEQRGYEFLESVFNNPAVLEELTGLKELQQQTVLAMQDWDIEDEDGADDDDEEEEDGDDF